MAGTVTIKTWKQLVAALTQIDGSSAWACRGEPRPYRTVHPSIDRRMERWGDDIAGRLHVEQLALIRFMTQAHLDQSLDERQLYGYMLESPQTAMMLMQHYAGPTRLADWSESLWTSAHFACALCPDTDGQIRYFNRYALEKAAHAKYGEETNAIWNESGAVLNLFNPEWVRTAHRWAVCYYLTGRRFPRLNAQQGFFTLASRPNLDHWRLIRRMLRPRDYGLIRIKAAAKPQILKHLAGMSITEKSVYQGLDGLGHAISSFVSYSHLDLGVQRNLRLTAAQVRTMTYRVPSELPQQ